MKKILFLIPLLLFMFSVMPVHAVWLEGYGACRDKTITETSGINVINKPLEFVVTGLTNKLSNNNDVRLVLGKCNEANTTIPFNVLSSSSDTVEFRVKYNLSANSVNNFSVYYNNSVAVAPSYSQIADYLENFEGASLNASYWTETTNDVVGSTSTDYARYGSKSWKVVISGNGKYDQIIHTYSPISGTFRAWFYESGDTSFKTGIEVSTTQGGSGGHINSDYSTANYTKRINDVYTPANVSRISTGSWFRVDVVTQDNNMTVYIQNQSVSYTSGANYTVTSINLYSSAYSGTGYTDAYELFWNVYDNPSQTFSETNGTQQTEILISPLQTISVVLNAPSNNSFDDNTSVRAEFTISKINVTSVYCEYSLDGNSRVNFSGCNNGSISLLTYSDHTLQIFATGLNLSNGTLSNSSAIVHFSNPSIPKLQELSITLDAPANESYRDNSSIRLEQTVNRINFTMGYCEYSLDGNAPVNTSCNNVTINLPYYGDHTLQVFVNAINLTADWFKNSSSILYFSNPSSTQNFTACFEITEYGQYYLQDDILDSGESQCITVSADNVLIDCMGHTIDGVGTGNSAGFTIESVNNVTVRHCKVKNWGYAISSSSVDGMILFDNELYDNTRNGILMDNIDNVFLINSSIHNNVNADIEINNVDTFYASGNTFYDSSTMLQMDGMLNSLFFNNVFNTTSDWIQGDIDNHNDWNNTARGNYWFKSTGDGFSDLCSANGFGFCDTVFVVLDLDNVDNMPLTHNVYSAPSGVGFTVEIIYPANSSYINVTSLNLNWVVTRKVNVTITQCKLSIDGAANITLSSCENTTLANLSYGDHYIDIFVTGIKLTDNSTMTNSTSVHFNTKYVAAVIPPIIGGISGSLLGIVVVIMLFAPVVLGYKLFIKRKSTKILPGELIEFVLITLILVTFAAILLTLL